MLMINYLFNIENNYGTKDLIGGVKCNISYLIYNGEKYKLIAEPSDEHSFLYLPV